MDTSRFLKGFVPEPEEIANAPDRIMLASDNLYPIVLSHEEDFRWLRNLQLISDSEFCREAKRLGLNCYGGSPDTDPTKFWKRGWLRADRSELRSRSKRRITEFKSFDLLDRKICESHPPAGRWWDYDLHLHQFRLIPLACILEMMRWNLVPSNILYGPGVLRYAKDYARSFQAASRTDSFKRTLNYWNGVADLAILLEPIYWPEISGVDQSYSMINSELRPENLWESYRLKILQVFSRIPKLQVATAHMILRDWAHSVDANAELYLILRSSVWEKRKKISGHLGMALFVRQVAELLRHAYDEMYEDRLVHEDEAGSTWVPGARAWCYGSEYPLDDTRELVRRVLPRWSLSSSPRVRFYVEGDTEQGALEYALEHYLGFKIEVINMRGQAWSQGLKEQLLKDITAKRFSFFMLDKDEEEPIRCLKAHASEGLIAGAIFLNDPDFEFGCFSTEELARAVSYYEESINIEAPSKLEAEDFDGITDGKSFQK